MKLIDFHTHIYPDAIAKKATESIENFYSMKAENVGTADRLLEVSRENGIVLSVVLPVAVKPSGVAHINDFAAEMQRTHKEFYCFGTVHAGMENIEAETERLMNMGLHGIKLHPDTQLFDIDDKRMYPVYEMIEGKIPLMVHSGDYRYSYSHPERLRRVMKDFPRLVTVAAHFGGWSMPDEGVRCLSDMKNCFVDISSSFDRISLRKGAELVSVFGEDRVLFASDFPLGSPTVERENLIKMNISDDVREKITYKNAEGLLGFSV